jgi:asparagine synthase (glutamine-hydrolysing)
MCGILGSIGPKNHFDPSALQTISHRGPDDQGYIREEDIFLGQTRLSIVDLSSNGHQPMI